MRFFEKIYSIKFYDNGFCWKVSVRDKTIEDYRRDASISLFFLTAIVAVILIG